MRLTPKGEALRRPLAAILHQIESALDLELPQLAQIRQAVHIVMADALGAFLGRSLQQAVGRAAPGIDLVLHPWEGGAAALAKLAGGTVDLAVSVLPALDQRLFHAEQVFAECYVVAMRDNHPAANDFGLDAWCDWPHVLVSAEGGTHTSVDDVLATVGKARRVAMVVPSFLLVPELLRCSDMMALIPTLCTAGGAGRGLAILAPPLPLEGFALQLAWHRRRDHDQAVRYVADEITKLLHAADLPKALTDARQAARRPVAQDHA